MGRIRDIGRAALDVARAAAGSPRDRMATFVPTGPDRRNQSPIRTVNRDRTLRASTAPPGARQQWELHRVREESRDLFLRSPIWGGYVRYTRIQAIGNDLSRLTWDRFDDEAKTRLAPVIARIRRDWNSFQMIRGVGGKGETLHQLAGQVLHHVLVDGDCFVTRRTAEERMVYDLHPGDSLAETSYNVGPAGSRQRQLGVETDEYGKPMAFWFGSGGLVARLNWGYLAPSGYGFDPRRVSSAMVWHVRDRSGESTAVRGWPRCTQVVEDIARLDEWYSALVRSATTRASVGIALERAEFLGNPAAMGGETGSFADRASVAGRDAGADTGLGGEEVRPYQEMETRAGSLLELEPGYKAHDISTGAPTSQEATAIGMLERRVCAALRTTPATLLGDYRSLSFSAGQLGHIQERQAIEDLQMILTMQLYGPVFRDFLIARWVALMVEFPGVLRPEDLDALRTPKIQLRRYQVIDKARLVKPLLDAYERGGITYAELRQNLGESGENVEEIIEEWKASRRLFGLPEVPGAGGGAGGKEDGEDDDTPAGKPGGKEDEEEDEDEEEEEEDE